jgi:hypothetical protein
MTMMIPMPMITSLGVEKWVPDLKSQATPKTLRAKVVRGEWRLGDYPPPPPLSLFFFFSSFFQSYLSFCLITHQLPITANGFHNITSMPTSLYYMEVSVYIDLY